MYTPHLGQGWTGTGPGESRGGCGGAAPLDTNIQLHYSHSTRCFKYCTVHCDIHTTFGVGLDRDGAGRVTEGGDEEDLKGRLLSMQIYNYTVPGVFHFVPCTAIYTPHLG